MKPILIIFMKIFFLLVLLELVLFVLMVFFVMTDESVGSVGSVLFFTLKFVMGFPLVIINDSYPFFLESQNTPSERIPLIVVNNILQAVIILILIGFFKKWI